MLFRTLIVFSRVSRNPRIPSKPVTLPRRIREVENRERMKAALNLLRLKEAPASNDESTVASQPRNEVGSLGDEMHATDESLDSASVEELAALEEATRRKYDRIVSELKKRKEKKQTPSDVGDSVSNVVKAPGPATTKPPRRSGRLTTATTREGQQATGDANQDNPDAHDAEPQQKSTPTHSRTEPATTAADDSTSAPLTNQKKAEGDDDSSVTQVVSNIVDAAVASVVGEDATSTTDTVAGMAANIEQKIDQDPTAHAAIESALTPVSEAHKDGDDQAPAVTTIKPTTSGVETPETEPNVADQSTSPADAMELD